MNLLEDYLREHHHTAAAMGLDDVHRTAAVLLSPQRNVSRYAIVLLLGESGRPQVVAKICRRPNDKGMLGAALAVLQHLSTHVSGRPVAPAPHGLVQYRGHWMLIQSAVGGTPLPRHALWKSREHLWRMVDRWLLDLPNAVDLSTTSPEWLDEHIGTPLRYAYGILKPTPGERELLASTEDLMREFAKSAAPAPTEHGDVTPSNFYLSANNELSAIDWELGYVNGLVGADATVFLETAFSAPTASSLDARVDAYARHFLEPDGACRYRLAAHLGARGVDAAWLDHVLLATWARRALQVIPRMTSCHLLDTQGTRVSSDHVTLAATMFRTGLPMRLWRRTLAHMA